MVGGSLFYKDKVNLGHKGIAFSGSAAASLLAFFIVGALIGSFVGSHAAVEDISINFVGRAASAATQASFYGALWNNGKFLLVIALLSTSLLGVIAVPALAAFRAYLISCSAAAIYVCYPENSLALTLITIGLPCLFTLPWHFILSLDSGAVVMALRKTGAEAFKSSEMLQMLSHTVIAAVFVTASALTELTLVPMLLKLFGIDV